MDNLGGSVGVCTEATGECQDEDPALEQGWLVGETMLLVAGCCGVGDWRLSSCGCPSWWMSELQSHQRLERAEVQMLVGRLALAQKGLAQGPKHKGPECSSWGVRPGAWGEGARHWEERRGQPSIVAPCNLDHGEQAGPLVIA